MKSYIQFLKEQNSAITIQNIYDALKEIFENEDVFSTDSVFEHNNDNLRLIISINKIYSQNEINIFTKLMFDVNDEKNSLISNKFKYLYEINCQFKEISFENLSDFKNKIINIITNNIFGNDLKTLSELIKKPEHIINEWFYKKNIKNLSVTGFKFDPDMKNIPCKELSFNFTMTINQKDDITLNIRKMDVDKFKLTFNIFNKNIIINKNDISNIEVIIGETLKNNYKK
jgi:hypothetical protein